MTGAKISYKETLYREIQLKPGETVDSAYKKGWSYSYKWDETKVDTRRGVFILVVRHGWNDDESLFMLMEDMDARRWLEEHRPSDVETYEKLFGPLQNQFSADASTGLATETISKLESKVQSQQWNLETKEKSIKEKDELIGRQASQIEDLQKKLYAMEDEL